MPVARQCRPQYVNLPTVPSVGVASIKLDRLVGQRCSPGVRAPRARESRPGAARCVGRTSLVRAGSTMTAMPFALTPVQDAELAPASRRSPTRCGPRGATIDHGGNLGIAAGVAARERDAAAAPPARGRLGLVRHDRQAMRERVLIDLAAAQRRRAGRRARLDRAARRRTTRRRRSPPHRARARRSCGDLPRSCRRRRSASATRAAASRMGRSAEQAVVGHGGLHRRVLGRDDRGDQRREQATVSRADRLGVAADAASTGIPPSQASRLPANASAGSAPERLASWSNKVAADLAGRLVGYATERR